MRGYVSTDLADSDMSREKPKDVTRVLEAAALGDREAARSLLPLVYDELRIVARARLRKLPPGQTLEPTALVHDAYLRVVGKRDPGWDSRGHFFGAAALAMRDILVEQARRKMSKKRGGDRRRVDAEGPEPSIESPSEDVLAVHEAVKRLESEDPRKGQIVNLRYFARMTLAETAKILGISTATVEREWRYIRAWLELQLREDEKA
jgi:RNA polymerase sigma factor (TIGR02999 family)